VGVIVCRVRDFEGDGAVLIVRSRPMLLELVVV
jgi:hypothetical protein